MSIEAMKQALETLETPIHEQPFGMKQHAITALRTAIEQAEKQSAERGEPVAHQDWCASLTQLLLSYPPKPAPCNCKPHAAPVQEPMAIASDDPGIYEFWARNKEAAQRQWVGLTMEDKMAYTQQDLGGSRLDAMDWADRRLQEKNGGNHG